MHWKTKLYYLFRVLITPNCWLQNNCYSKYWDTEFTKLLNTEKFSERGPYTAKLGKYKIWVSNFPFACMNVYHFPGNDIKLRPKRTTILMAWDKLNRERPIEKISRKEEYERKLKEYLGHRS